MSKHFFIDFDVLAPIRLFPIYSGGKYSTTGYTKPVTYSYNRGQK